MKIISFAWTTPALLAGRKTVTRRYWNSRYATGFRAGDCCQAYNRNPRNGGKPVAIIKILSIAQEPVSTMPDSEYEAEGFAYLNKPFSEFEAWRRDGSEPYVIRFSVVRILDAPVSPGSLRNTMPR